MLEEISLPFISMYLALAVITFNVVTASARDKEIKGKEIPSSIIYVELK